MCELKEINRRLEKTEIDIKNLALKYENTNTKLDIINKNIQEYNKSNNKYFKVLVFFTGLIPFIIHLISKGV